MTETVSNEIEATNEKEIIIDINDNPQEPAVVEPEREVSTPVEINEPPPKKVGLLNAAEKELIINNAKNNIDMQNYRVTNCKNGAQRIVLKKPLSAVAAKVINSAAPPSPALPTQATYTDNQVLMEHIIELNSKYEKMHLKQKKLKKKYRNMKNDVYSYEREIDDAPELPPPQIEPPQQEHRQTSQVMTRNENIPTAYRTQYNARNTWRNRVTVL